MNLTIPTPWDAVAEGYDRLVRPSFTSFSTHALDLAAVGPEHRILDVATGPGTLPLLAAARVAEVVAVDFSEEMLRMCRHNVAGLGNVTVQQGDGQQLAYEAEFDAAFSLFGLMFFPDRAAGFAGLHRALRPGGTAVVSCWPPFAQSTAMVRSVDALSAAFPGAPEPALAEDPLDRPEVLERELRAAGFVDVEVVPSRHEFTATVEELWSGVAEGFAPIALARRTMPEGVWAAAEARGLSWLHANHDPDEVLTYVALLGKGRRAG